MYTSLRILSAPGAEPVSIDTLRKHLRADQDFEDDLLAIYLTSARTLAEGFLNRALITQTLQWFAKRHESESERHTGWDWLARRFPAIELPRPPAQAIVSLSVLDRIGNTTAIALPNAISLAPSATLQFPAVGFPASVVNGTFVTDLTTAAVPIGATVQSVATVGSVTTVTLTAPLVGNVAIGDAVVFSAVAPRVPLPVPASPSPAPSLYLVDLSLEPARLRLDWPVLSALGTVTDHVQHIEIDYTAGYGADGSMIPAPITNAILMLAAFLYERRGDDGGEMPEFVKSLLWNHRVPSFGES